MKNSKKRMYFLFLGVMSLYMIGCGKNPSDNNVKETMLKGTLEQIETQEVDKRNEIIVETHEKDIGEEKLRDSEEEKKMITKEQAKSYKAFECVNIEELSAEEIECFFSIQEIDEELFNRINGVSYHENEFVKPENLRYLRVLHFGFDKKVHVGELIVNEIIADKIMAVMKGLYEGEYPIEKMLLVDEYQGDDDLSMGDNNSSAFNYRTISGTTKISNHGYGLAIDINPFFNPYIHKKNGVMVCDPVGSEEFMDRSKSFLYKIDENDLAYQLLTKEGFSWGGAWKNSKDYQHFEYNHKE